MLPVLASTARVIAPTVVRNAGFEGAKWLALDFVVEVGAEVVGEQVSGLTVDDVFDFFDALDGGEIEFEDSPALRPFFSASGRNELARRAIRSSVCRYTFDDATAHMNNMRAIATKALRGREETGIADLSREEYVAMRNDSGCPPVVQGSNKAAIVAVGVAAAAVAALIYFLR